MSDPVRRTHLVPDATPADVYAVVTDFAAYPRLFPEIKAARVLETDGSRVRVEFRGQIVVPFRYVLDLVCDASGPSVEWSYVEGEVVTGSSGAWRFAPEGTGTRVDYRVALEIRAPLPGFVLRKVTDGLVSLSLPAMFGAIEREVAFRKARGG